MNGAADIIDTMTSTPPDTRDAAPVFSWRIFGPTLVLIAGLAVYSAYWYVAAGKTREAIERFAAAPAEKIAVGWDTFSISGFPYRIEADFVAPIIRAPNAPEAWEWSAENLEADFLPYNLRHVVLKIEGGQLLKYRDVSGAARQTHTVSMISDGAWASYVAIDGAPVGRLAIDINNLVALHDTGTDKPVAKAGAGKEGRFAAGRLQLHAQPAATDPGSPPAPGDAASYDIALQGDDIDLERLAASKVLGERMTLFAAQARLRNLPASANASPVEMSREWLANGGRLAVSDLAVKWGALDLMAQGEVTLDRQMRPEGRLDAAIADYAGLVSALVKAKVVNEKDARVALVGIGLVAQLQGDKSGRVHVPVLMKDGRLFLGPLLVATLDPLF